MFLPAGCSVFSQILKLFSHVCVPLDLEEQLERQAPQRRITFEVCRLLFTFIKPPSHSHPLWTEPQFPLSSTGTGAD